MYGLSQAVLTCLPPELKGARLFPNKCRGGRKGGGHRKEACTHTTHSRVEAGVGYRCRGLTRGSQGGGPAAGRLVYRQETHRQKHPKEPGYQLSHATMWACKRRQMCVVYTEIHTGTYTEAAETCSNVFTHTDPHKHTCTCTHTQRIQIQMCQAKPRRQREEGLTTQRIQLPKTQHMRVHVRIHTHTHSHTSTSFTGAFVFKGHAIKTSCWERKRLCVLGGAGMPSSCSSSRIRARPIPFLPCPGGGRSGRARRQAGVGAPAGPAPTLGRCLWRAAQNPESHTDPRPRSGPGPRRSPWPCPQACFNPGIQTETCLWPRAPCLACAYRLAFFFFFNFNKVIKGQSLELERCELESRLCHLSTG